MNVTTNAIRNLKPGELGLFACEDGSKIKSARSLVSILKETGMPEGIVDYEYKKYELETGLVFVIHALGEGDSRIFRK